MRHGTSGPQPTVAPSPDPRDGDAANDGPDYALCPLHSLETTARSFLPHPQHRSRPLRSRTFAAGLSPTLSSASGVQQCDLVAGGTIGISSKLRPSPLNAIIEKPEDSSYVINFIIARRRRKGAASNQKNKDSDRSKN